MIGKLLVFVSSTSDLSTERKALKNLFAQHGGVYEGYFYEDDPARSDRPEDRCRAKIEDADVFVGVLGAKYGSPYPPPGDGGSIVQWEFETAERRRDLSLVAVIIKKLPDAQVEPPQKQFIEHVRNFRGRWCREYDSMGELQDEVLKSLVQWSGEIVARTLEEEHDSKRRRRRFLIPSAVASVLAVVALFALDYALALRLPPAALVGACALDCVFLLAMLMLTF